VVEQRRNFKKSFHSSPSRDSFPWGRERLYMPTLQTIC